MAEVDWTVTSGVAQLVTLNYGDLVQVNTNNRPVIYTYLGLTTLSANLATQAYSDASLWSKPTIFANTGKATLQVTNAGSLTAGDDIEVLTGGGADSLTVLGPITTTRGSVIINLANSETQTTQTISLTGAVNAQTNIDIRTTGDSVAKISTPGIVTASGDIIVMTGDGNDILLFESTLTGKNVTVISAAGSDKITLTDDIVVTAGNLKIDMGTDADLLNTLSVTGALSATGDIRIYTLPKANFEATIGVYQSVRVASGDLVLVTTGTKVALYKYVGSLAKTINIGSDSVAPLSNNYSDTTLWAAVSGNPDTSGTMTITLANTGTVTAGGAIDIWTGGGDDTLKLDGKLQSQGDTRIQTGYGNDSLAVRGGMKANVGSILVDMGGSDSGEEQVMSVTSGIVTAGTDVKILSSGAADFTLTLSDNLVAGQDILISSKAGADSIALFGTVTAGRNLSILTDAANDALKLYKEMTATTGYMLIDLGFGVAGGTQTFEAISTMVSGGAMALRAYGPSANSLRLLDSVTAGSTFEIDTGTGKDAIFAAKEIISVGAFVISSGAGADSVILAGNMASTASSVRIDLGSGGSSSFGGEGEFLNLNSLLNAATSITIVNSNTNGAVITLDEAIVAGTSFALQGAFGSEIIAIKRSLTAGTDILFATGGGADTVTLDKTVTATIGSITFDLGAVTGAGSTLHLLDELDAGANITLKNSGPRGATYLLDKSATAGLNFSLIGGSGNEIVTFNGVITATALVSWSLGAGADVVQVTATSGIISKQSDVMLDMGAGDAVADTLDIKGNISAYNSLVLTDAGLGNSVVTLQAISAQVGRGGVAVTLSAGADYMTMTDVALTTAGDMSVSLGDGDDLFAQIAGSINVTKKLLVDAGAGNDTLLFQTGSVRAVASTLQLGDGVDYLRLMDLSALGGTSIVLGGAGVDTVDVIRLPGQGANDSLLIDGGADSDTVNVLTFGSETGAAAAVNYDIRVFDTGSSGRGLDRLNIFGTSDDDTFLSRTTYVALLHGTPEQNLTNAAGRPADQERISYNSNIDAGLVVMALAGDDLLISDDNSAATILDGGDGNDRFVMGQIYGSAPSGESLADIFESTQVTRGHVTNGARYDTLLRGGAGTDTFTVNSINALLRVEAGDGDDSVTVQALLKAKPLTASDLYKVNGLIEVVGGNGTDSLRVYGTEQSDALVSAMSGIWGAGLNISLSQTEEFIDVDAREGDDALYLQSSRAGTATRLIGDLGNDFVSIAGDGTRSILVAASSGAIDAGGTSMTPVTYAATASMTIDAWVAKAGKTAVGQSDILVTEKTFGAGSHLLGSISGPVLVDAGRVYAQRFSAPVFLQKEAYTAAAAITSLTSESTTADRIVVFNDGASTALTGTMATSVGFDGRSRTLLSGLGMVTGSLTLGTSGGVDGVRIYQRGISFGGFETTELLNGTEADTISASGLNASADSTAVVAMTVIYGGAGADRITVTSIGDGSALAVFGDSDTYGARYSDVVGSAGGNGWAFNALVTSTRNTDFIDLSQLTASGGAGIIRVGVDGGTGNDTILGGADHDILAGGSGDDMIFGGAGDDVILGDGGLTVGMVTREVMVASIAVTSTAKPSADSRAPGYDDLSGGDGDDVMIGDLAALASTTGTTFQLGKVWSVAALRSTDTAKGNSDILDGGLGNDLMVGGLGADRIGSASTSASGALGDDILIGDFADILFRQTGTGLRAITTITSTATAVGGADTLRSGAGADILIGGTGADVLYGGDGANILGGDHLIVSFDTTVTSRSVTAVETLMTKTDGNDTLVAGNGSSVMLGGNGSDSITVGGGDHILIGDNARIVSNSTNASALSQPMRQVTEIVSLSATEGGADTIVAGNGGSIVMAGVGDDTIRLGNASASGAGSIVIGDHAKLTFDGTTGLALHIDVAFSGLGGADTITLGNVAGIVMGGAYADTITVGNGNVLIVGDEGLIAGTSMKPTASGSIPMNLSSVATTIVTAGGADVINTGSGSSIILGGEGGDKITTSAGLAANTPAGANIILGDHGQITFAAMQAGSGLPVLIESLLATNGGADTLQAGAGNDVIIGGFGADVISASAGNNVIFGDHAKITGIVDPATYLTASAVYVLSSKFTGATEGGAADVITGGAGQDLIVGGQGADILYGMAGDDDIIGGHFLNALDIKLTLVTASSDLGDVIDAGLGNDAVLGDSGSILRKATDLRMRTGGTTADATAMASPDSPSRGYWLFTSPTLAAGTFGADMIAGGAGNDALFGQAGADVIQGDGALDLNRNGKSDISENLGVGAWSGADAYAKLISLQKAGAKFMGQSVVGATGGSTLLTPTSPGMLDYVFGSLASPEIGTVGGGVMLAVKASITDFAGVGTDGDDYIEGGSGSDVVFGNGGQDDIIGGSSDLFGGLLTSTGSAATAANAAGADILFGGSGGSVGELSSASGSGHAREGNSIAAGNATILRFVASGGYQYVSSVLSNTSANVVRRSVQLLDGATVNAANLSYLIGTGAQDMIVKSTLGDVAFGTKSAAQMRVNVSGGSVLSAQDNAVSLTSIYSGVTRDAPSVAKVAYLVNPAVITVAAPLAAGSAKGTPTYTYNAATKTFTPVTSATRSYSQGSTAVIDLKTTTKQVSYFDSKGGFWMVA